MRLLFVYTLIGPYSLTRKFISIYFSEFIDVLSFPPGGVSLLRTGVVSVLACHYIPTLCKGMTRSLTGSLSCLLNMYCFILLVTETLFYLGRQCAQINYNFPEPIGARVPTSHRFDQ